MIKHKAKQLHGLIMAKHLGSFQFSKNIMKK